MMQVNGLLLILAARIDDPCKTIKIQKEVSWPTLQPYSCGSWKGAEDVREGRIHDSKCPPNDRLSFCTGYKYLRLGL